MVDQVTDPRRTRRSVLTAAAAAGAATVASAIARPFPVAAAGNDGAIIHIGDFYADVRSQTTLGNDTSNENVLWVSSNDDGLGNASGWGTAVTGYSTHGTGVLGLTSNGNGIHGSSSGSTGVFGDSTSGYGVYGSSNSNVGVFGSSTSGSGVYGTTSSGSAPGVFGSTTGHQTAIQGFQGVNAPAPRANTGVMGTAEAAAGTGGYFEAGGIGGHFVSSSGNAIRVEGKASFTRAGRVSIPKNRAYVDITVAGGLAATAAIVATLQVQRGTCAVTSVRVNYPSPGKARIYLNKVASTTATTPVGYFVIG